MTDKDSTLPLFYSRDNRRKKNLQKKLVVVLFNGLNKRLNLQEPLLNKKIPANIMEYALFEYHTNQKFPRKYPYLLTDLYLN